MATLIMMGPLDIFDVEVAIFFGLQRPKSPNTMQHRSSNSVVFRESVRKNAWDCFEKKGFAENRHFQGTASFGYLEAIKCHFEARK